MMTTPSSDPQPGVPTPSGNHRLDLPLVVVAWLLIAVATLLWMAKPGPEAGSELDEGVDNSIEMPSGRLLGAQDELTGRLALGIEEMFPGLGLSQATPLANGDIAQQIAYAVLEAAMGGSEPALERLEEIDPGPVADLLVPAALDAIENGEAGMPPSSASATLLEERLGWFGTLAGDLSDPTALERLGGEAASAVGWLLGCLALFAVAGLAGFVGLLVVVVSAALDPRAIRIPVPSRSGLYAETFAIWLFVMLGLQVVAAAVSGPGFELLGGTAAFFGSLSALAWPLVRGKSWAEVRHDIGLQGPRISDLPIGVATWSMALPFLGVGVVLTLLLTLLIQFTTGEIPQPGHPAQQAAMGAGFWQIVQLFLLASVAAPIVEEIMFRGVLLGHLRGATGRWNVWLSIGFAVLTSSVIFAAIHPQGPVFIPPLAGLAAGFCVGRIWSGRLGPAIVAHGVSNGLVMSLNVVLFG